MIRWLVCLMGALAAAGCLAPAEDEPVSISTAPGPGAPSTEPLVKTPSTGRIKPPPGAAGGTAPQLVEIGPEYRGEIVLGKKGAIKLYTLGKDSSSIVEVEVQKLEAQVRIEGRKGDPVMVPLEPVPQRGDAEGKTSQFVGKFPRELWEKPLYVTIPITIARQRYRFSFPLEGGGHPEDEMPVKVPDAEEKALYLSPGGKYTAADIRANGGLTASQKYDVAGWPHDARPRSGEKICPVTLTKSNPTCTWVIAGKTYEFCCPPCIDAFVQIAKESPDEIKDPEYYRKK